MPDGNRQILLVETPKGKLGLEHFRLAEAPLPTPREGAQTTQLSKRAFRFCFPNTLGQAPSIVT